MSNSPDIEPELLTIFFEESAEHLSEIEESLLLAESLPDDPSLIDRIFRAAHTVKGNSAMFCFDAIAQLTHSMENMIGSARDTTGMLTSDELSLLFPAVDELKLMIAAARLGPVSLSRRGGELIAWMNELVPAAKQVESVAPADTHIEQAPPPAEEPIAEERTADRVATESTSVRLPVEKIDRLVNLVGELVIAQAIAASVAQDFHPRRLPELIEAIESLGKHCRDLQTSALEVRMAPLRPAFVRFQRMVRDTAAMLSKQVHLDIIGADTELDKTMIDKIGDPLTHIVRNAIDHGLETPAQRAASGKPEQGTIALRAYQQGGSVFIEVEDDGRGLNLARIREKALSKGLLSAEARPTDAELRALIFHPGFSTVDAVTQLSGRGVGMDVVKRNVESLKGTIEIESTAGKGTTVRLCLPLTLAIIDGMCVKVDQETYVIPVRTVVELITAQRSQLTHVPGCGTIVNVRGDLIPVAPLHRVLGARAPRSTNTAILVVVEAGKQRIALQIDEMVGMSQAVLKSIETNYRGIAGVSAATVLGDGTVALVLDPLAIAGVARSNNLDRATLSGAVPN